MINVSVIIPTYNEKDNIPLIIKQLDMYLRDIGYEIVIVDDNSPDGTADVAEELSSKYPVRVIRRPRKMGLTSAIYDGMRYARGDVIIVMDADLQHPPSVIPKLVSRTSDCDVVIASRYIEGGKIERWSFTRRFISRCAVLLTKLIISECRMISDPVSGFFAAKRNILEKWKPIVPEGYKALVEILHSTKPERVCEEPFVFTAREKGESKLSTRIMVSYAKTLIKLNPLVVFGSLAIAIVILGLLIIAIL